MPAVVVGVDGVAGAAQRLGEPLVAEGVFADAVGDLDDAARFGRVPGAGQT